MDEIQTNRLGNPNPQRVAVVRALGGLGDMLCAIPALRALRAGLPEAHITLIGLPWATSIVERFNHYLDALLEFPGFPGIPEHPVAVTRLPAFLDAVQKRPFDLVIQMHGNGISSNLFAVLLGAPALAGFYLPGQYCPDRDRFLPYPAHDPEIWRHLRLMEFLGLPLQGDDLEFPLMLADQAALAGLPEAARLEQGNYVCLHPGAHDQRRRWAPDYFAAVADGLAAQGLRVVLTGAAGEMPVVAAVEKAMHAPAINLAGQTSLGALAALIKRSRLVICNDTGVSHLAAALRTPSVVIFLASNPQRWAPLDRQRHRRVGRPGLAAEESGCDCPLDLRCLRDACLRPSPPAADGLAIATPRHVLAEAYGLLRSQQSITPAGSHVA